MKYPIALGWATEIERVAEGEGRPGMELFFELLDEFRAEETDAASQRRGKNSPTSSMPAHGAGARRLCGALRAAGGRWGTPLWLGRSAPRLQAATLGRASKSMTPTSCFNGQVNRLPDSPEAYGTMITRPMAAPAPKPLRKLFGGPGLS